MGRAVISRLLAKVRDVFVQSRRVHLRQNPAENVQELVGLIDRFLDGPMRYDLEWDDFISWKNSNAHVEQIRDRIGQFEPLLFSKSKEDRAIYRQKLIEERDSLACLVGLPMREPHQ